MEIKHAYKQWQIARMVTDDRCCYHHHFVGTRAITDASVCDRELWWRRYVRLRDNDPTWMPKVFKGIYDDGVPNELVW